MPNYKRKKGKYKLRKNNFWEDNYLQIIVLLLVFLIGVVCYNISRYQTSVTAVVDGRMVSVSPKVAGNVTHLYVENKQEVKKGDLILELDSAYYEIRLNQAVFNLRKAKEKYNLKEDDQEENPKLVQKNNNRQSQITRYNFSDNKFNNYEKMYDDEEINQEPEKGKEVLLDSKEETPQKQEELKNKNETEEKEEPVDIKKLENEVEQARLDLSNTKIYASCSGVITNIDIEEGEYVEAGQKLLSIIPQRMYVVAGFRIDEQNPIREGQQAEIKIPTYSRRKFRGIVDSVQTTYDDAAKILPFKNEDEKLNTVVARIVFTEDYSEYNIPPLTNAVAKVKVK